VSQNIPNSDSLRVALVSGGLAFGGTTTFDLFLGGGLQKLGVPAKVFSFSSHHPMRADFDDLVIPVHLEDERRLIYEDRLAGIYGAVRAFAPHAVFAVLGSESFELLRYLPKDVLKVGMLHDDHPGTYNLVRRYSTACDHLVTIAANIADRVQRELPGLPCTRLLPGSLFADGRRVREPNPREPLKVLYYGRLVQVQKQVLMLPEIWSVLKHRNISIRWTIHGQGPDEAALRRGLAEASQAGEVNFSPPVPFNQLGDMIRRHDVFIVTSRHEAGPITLVEAMGHGLVPVCADIPCLIQEMVNPQNGFRVQMDAPKAYAEAIERLDGDRVMLERMSAAALQTINADFTAEAMAQRYVDFIRRNAPPVSRVEWPARIKIKPMLGSSGVFWIRQKSGTLQHAYRLLKRLRH